MISYRERMRNRSLIDFDKTLIQNQNKQIGQLSDQKLKNTDDKSVQVGVFSNFKRRGEL